MTKINRTSESNFGLLDFSYSGDEGKILQKLQNRQYRQFATIGIIIRTNKFNFNLIFNQLQNGRRF